MTEIVVCIVGFNNPDDVERCIASLAASTYQRFEVVICENAGVEACEELRRRLPTHLPGGQSVSILPYEGNSGYAGGNNRCIAARPDAAAWWILNPDARVAPDAMALLMARLDSGELDAVGSTLLKSDGRVQAYGGRWTPLLARAVSIGNGEDHDPASARLVSGVDYILGASVMFTARFLSEVGPMREDYFLYGEEVEWGLRANRRGLRLGVETAALVHHEQGTTTGDGGGFSTKPKLPVYLDQRNRVLVLRDTRPALLIPGAIGTLFALAARAAKKRAWRQFGYGVSGWLAGVANHRGTPPCWRNGRP